MRLRGTMLTLFAAALLAVLSGCTDPPPEVEYGITSFEASHTTVQAGETVEFTWQATARDDTCLLQANTNSGVGELEEVVCQGSRSIVIEESVVFQLSALTAPGGVYDVASVTIKIATEDVTVTLLPGAFTLASGERRDVTASVSGIDDTAVTWSATGGRIEGSGSVVEYVAGDVPGAYEVTATSQADASEVGRAAVTIEASGIASFSASQSRVQPGDTVQLDWSASAWEGVCYLQSTTSSGAGTESRVPCDGSRDVVVNESVVYQLAALINPDEYDVRTLTVGVETEDVGVTVLPGSFQLGTGESRALTASVTGTDDERVTWSATGGEILGSGASVTYVAPETPGSYQITATSVADTSASVSAVATVEQLAYGFAVTVEGAYDTAPSGGSIAGLTATSSFELSEPMWAVVTVTNTGTRTANDLEILADLSQAPDVSGGWIERYRRTESGSWTLVEDRASEAGRIPEFGPGEVARLVFATDAAFASIGTNTLRFVTDRVAEGPLESGDVASDQEVIDVIIDASDLEADVTRLVTVRSAYPYPGPGVSDPYGFAARKTSSLDACGRDSYGAYGVSTTSGDHRWACLAWSVDTSRWDAQLDTVVEVLAGGGSLLCTGRFSGSARDAWLDLDGCASAPSGTVFVRVGRDDGERVAFGPSQEAVVLPRIDLTAPVEGSVTFVGGTYLFEWNIEGTLPSAASTELRMYDIDASDSGGAPPRGSYWDVQYPLSTGAESAYPANVAENRDDHHRWFVRSTLTVDSVSTAHSVSEKHRMCRMQAIGDSSNCSYAFTGSD